MACGVSFPVSLSIAEGPQAVSLNVSLDRFVVDCDPGPAGISYSILAGECTLIGIRAWCTLIGTCIQLFNSVKGNK